MENDLDDEVTERIERFNTTNKETQIAMARAMNEDMSGFFTAYSIYANEAIENIENDLLKRWGDTLTNDQKSVIKDAIWNAVYRALVNPGIMHILEDVQP